MACSWMPIRVGGRLPAPRLRPFVTRPRQVGRCRVMETDRDSGVGAEEEEGALGDLRVSDLREELLRRGLPVSGRKAELVARLEAWRGGEEEDVVGFTPGAFADAAVAERLDVGVGRESRAGTGDVWEEDLAAGGHGGGDDGGAELVRSVTGTVTEKRKPNKEFAAMMADFGGGLGRTFAGLAAQGMALAQKKAEEDIETLRQAAANLAETLEQRAQLSSPPFPPPSHGPRRYSRVLKAFVGEDELEELEAAYLAARKRRDAVPFTLRGFAASAPHPDQLAQGRNGDDAYFVGRGAVGIADGVGGWEQVEAGIAAQYAAAVMDGAQRAHEGGEMDPLQLLGAGYETVVEAGNVGSCTACVAVLNDKGRLVCSNLGDSGFVLLRQRRVDATLVQKGGLAPLAYAAAVRSEPQQHFFNCPFQLMFDGTNVGDPPQVADTYNIKPRDGDIVLLATDGVFDNMYTEDLEALVNVHLPFDGAGASKPADAALQGLADAIVARAQALGADETYDSPFQRAWESFDPDDEPWRGGKLDDTTVVVARVGKKKARPPARASKK